MWLSHGQTIFTYILLGSLCRAYTVRLRNTVLTPLPPSNKPVARNHGKNKDTRWLLSAILECVCVFSASPNPCFRPLSVQHLGAYPGDMKENKTTF